MHLGPDNGSQPACAVAWTQVSVIAWFLLKTRVERDDDEGRLCVGASRRNNGYQTDDATSRRMSAIRPVDTSPEIAVRRILTAMKVRYRLHGYRLPGRPDIVIPKLRKVIFVHGCYWHRHPGCSRTTTPVRNSSLWDEKFKATVERDAKNVEKLTELGWDHLIVWECQVRSVEVLEATLRSYVLEG